MSVGYEPLILQHATTAHIVNDWCDEPTSDDPLPWRIEANAAIPDGWTHVTEVRRETTDEQ